MLKKVFLILGAVAIGIGLWGVYIRLTAGHSEANYGSYVVWGLWVAMYMFFAGVAAGAFMLATLDLLFNIKLFKDIGVAVFKIANPYIIYQRTFIKMKLPISKFKMCHFSREKFESQFQSS